MSTTPQKIARDLTPDDNLTNDLNDTYSGKGEIFEQPTTPAHLELIKAQSILSILSEAISTHPNLKNFAKTTHDFSATYNPSYPPMSPVTNSFFNLWLSTDLPLEKGLPGTVASSAPFFKRKLKIPDSLLEIISHLSHSRMGFYEITNQAGENLEAKEIPTGKTIRFLSRTTHIPKIGEIWFIRIFSPENENAESLTSPYILDSSTNRNDLEAFFERHEISKESSEDALKTFFKRPKDPRFWFEYIINGYARHTESAIFLAGIPDIEESLPHSRQR